MNVGEE